MQHESRDVNTVDIRHSYNHKSYLHALRKRDRIVVWIQNLEVNINKFIVALNYIHTMSIYGV